ncbi:MAG: hypothetical protein SGARI_007704, partial [Bacillariaceae sp.]
MSDGLYLFHGILMGAAWFFFAPLAIGISLARRCAKKDSALFQNGLWYNIHFYSALTAVLFTIIGFIIVFVGGEDDDDRRALGESADEDGASEDGESLIAFGLSEDAADDIHKKLGIAILALALFQGLLGFIRPTAFQNTSTTGDTFQKPQPAPEDDPTFVGNVEMTSQRSDDESGADRERVYGVAPEQIGSKVATPPKKSTL